MLRSMILCTVVTLNVFFDNKFWIFYEKDKTVSMPRIVLPFGDNFMELWHIGKSSQFNWTWLS